MSTPAQYADVVYGWLFWAVWSLARRRGEGVVSSYRAAREAGADLYARSRPRRPNI